MCELPWQRGLHAMQLRTAMPYDIQAIGCVFRGQMVVPHPVSFSAIGGWPPVTPFLLQGGMTGGI
jgi:hypothetical protein